jgi:hypothetical protein
MARTVMRSCIYLSWLASGKLLTANVTEVTGTDVIDEIVQIVGARSVDWSY